MPKHKAFLKQAKAKKKTEQTLETADDYLAAGVEHEDAAGKWRAGDAAKSMRFFTRAVDIYEQGLRKFPASLDLAYNKARVQYEVATHPVLVKQLHEPILRVLDVTLNSHRYALTLDPENADSLFNTSQVLTSIAEEILKDDHVSDADALPLLKEALELQNECFSIQELKLEESKQQELEAAELLNQPPLPDDMGAMEETASEDSSEVGQQDDQWVSVVEPVTADTLIDTVLAQLGTLTTLCGALSSSPSATPNASLPWIEEFSSKFLEARITAYLESAHERRQEVALAQANFVSALVEAGFRQGKIDDSTYKRERDAIFAVPVLDIEHSESALMANAYSLMSFNSALAEQPSATPSSAASRWNALSSAITNLAKASKMADLPPEDLPKTHALRGDCSLLQHQLGSPPTSYQPALTNAAQLLKNAEVFYRNAAKLFHDREEADVATLRASMAWGLARKNVEDTVNAPLSARGQEWKLAQLQDMVDEGLLSNDFMSA